MTAQTILFSAALALALGAVACDDDGSRSATDVGRVDAGADASDAVDASDARDASGDTAGAVDARDADTGPPPMEFDESMWSQPNPCEGEVSYPPDDEPFSVPERGEPDLERELTRDEIVAFAGLPLRGWAVMADQSLTPGPGWQYDLYREPGDIVEFSVYALNNDTENLDDFLIHGTVLVDYEPVEAEYVRWNAERTNALLEKVGRGVDFPMDSNVEILDIRIPSEVFNENRAYEIGLTVHMASIGKVSSRTTRRYILYNGGYSRPSRPCAESRLGDEFTDIESELQTRIAFQAGGYLFPEGITDRDYVRDVIDVRPEETRTMYFFVSARLCAVAPDPRRQAVLLRGATRPHLVDDRRRPF